MFFTDQTSERFLLCSPGTSWWWKLGSYPPLPRATNLQMPNLAFASMTSVLPCQLVSLKLAPAGMICSQTCRAGTWPFLGTIFNRAHLLQAHRLSSWLRAPRDGLSYFMEVIQPWHTLGYTVQQFHSLGYTWQARLTLAILSHTPPSTRSNHSCLPHPYG